MPPARPGHRLSAALPSVHILLNTTWLQALAASRDVGKLGRQLATGRSRSVPSASSPRLGRSPERLWFSGFRRDIHTVPDGGIVFSLHLNSCRLQAAAWITLISVPPIASDLRATNTDGPRRKLVRIGDGEHDLSARQHGERSGRKSPPPLTRRLRLQPSRLHDGFPTPRS